MTLGFLHDSFKAQFDTLGKGGRMARTIDDSRSFLTYIKVLFKHVETSDNATSFPGWNQLVSEIIKYESLQKTLEPLMEDRLINKQSQSFPMPSASAPVKV